MSVCNPGDYLDYKLSKGGCYFTDRSENKTFAYRSLTKEYFIKEQITLGIPLVKMEDLFNILKTGDHVYSKECSLAIQCLDAFKDVYDDYDKSIYNIYLCIFYCLICYKKATVKQTMKSYFKDFFPIKFRTNILEYLPKEKRVQHINTLNKMYTINGVEKSWCKDVDDYMSDLIISIFNEYNDSYKIKWEDMFEFPFDQTLQHIVFELRIIDDIYKAFHIDGPLKPDKIQKLVEEIYSKLQCEFTWGIELETNLLYYYNFIRNFVRSRPTKGFIIKTGKSSKNMPSIFITHEERQLEFQSEVRSIYTEHNKPPHEDCGIDKKCKVKECKNKGVFVNYDDYKKLLLKKKLSQIDDIDDIDDIDELLSQKIELLSQKIDDIDDIVKIFEDLPYTVCEDHMHTLKSTGKVFKIEDLCVPNINVLEFTLGIFNHGSDTRKNENQMSIFKRLYTFIDDYFNHHFERKKSYIKTSKINTSETSQIKSPFKKLKSRHSTKRSMHKKMKKLSTKRSMHKKLKKHSTKRSIHKKMKKLSKS